MASQEKRTKLNSETRNFNDDWALYNKTWGFWNYVPGRFDCYQIQGWI